MGKTSQIVIAIIVIIFGAISSGQSVKLGHEIYKKISQFSSLIYEEFGVDYKSDNFILSSFTVWMSLFMISQGTSGETQREILSALNYNENYNNNFVKKMDEILVGKHKIQSFKKNISSCFEFNTAYMLFLHDGLSINEKFITNVIKPNAITISSVDLSNKNATINEINYWMNEQVNSQRDKTNFPYVNDWRRLDSHTGFLLTIATSLKALWRVSKKNPSVNEDFYLQKNKTKKVPMLTDNLLLNYDFMPSGAATFVTFPSTDANVSVVIVLPNKDESGNLRWIESEIESVSPVHYFKAEKEMVQLQIPKIKLETVTDLGPVLLRFGIKKLFRSFVEFTGIVKPRYSLNYLPQIIHTASIEIGEVQRDKLTPADDTPKANGKLTGAKNFKVDRPFFVIVCTRDTILFTGRIFDPTVNKIKSY